MDGIKMDADGIFKKCPPTHYSFPHTHAPNKARGLELPGFEAWGRSLRTQLRRFVDGDGEGAEGGAATEGAAGDRGQRCSRGWERAVGGDMNAVYQHLLAPADRERCVLIDCIGLQARENKNHPHPSQGSAAGDAGRGGGVADAHGPLLLRDGHPRRRLTRLAASERGGL